MLFCLLPMKSSRVRPWANRSVLINAGSLQPNRGSRHHSCQWEPKLTLKSYIQNKEHTALIQKVPWALWLRNNNYPLIVSFQYPLVNHLWNHFTECKKRFFTQPNKAAMLFSKHKGCPAHPSTVFLMSLCLLSHTGIENIIFKRSD